MQSKTTYSKTLSYILYGISYSIIIFALIYSLLWFGMLGLIARNLNKDYANQDLNIQNFIADEAFVRFSHISPAGFPFKIALKIYGMTEEVISGKTEYQAPIILGYDLLKQDFFASYNGQIISKYKPLQNNFGAKINVQDYQLFIHTPLKPKLVRVLYRATETGNIWPIVNFIKNFGIKSSQIKATDLVDDAVLYIQDHQYVKIAIERPQYYVSVQEFLDNIPKKVNVEYATQISHSNINKKIIPSFLIGSFSPFSYSSDSAFYVQTTASKYQDLPKDIELKIHHLNHNAKTISASSKVFYRSILNDDRIANMTLKADGHVNLKSGFVDQLFNALEQMTIYLGSNPAISAFVSKLQLDAKERGISADDIKSSLKELENRIYDKSLDLSINFDEKNKSLSAQVKDFSILSGVTGIRLNSKLDIRPDHSKNGFFQKFDGFVLLSNYQKLINIIDSNYQHFAPLFSAMQEQTVYQSQEKRIADRKVQLAQFLKSFSDHPLSTSNDLSFEYKIRSDDLENSQIGSTTLGKLKEIYYISTLK